MHRDAQDHVVAVGVTCLEGVAQCLCEQSDALAIVAVARNVYLRVPAELELLEGPIQIDDANAITADLYARGACHTPLQPSQSQRDT